ncbi:MAG: DNA-binding protein [Pseudomonadales bacterium]|mgnify:FL=1|nr:DNA-binding protein [Pseudomonadales bacterium]|tara:strand:+ start:371 stop:868 length:498 start_codon:yes stop_codon:yes gene_type:complete
MNNVIPFHYQGQPVRFNTAGWINATDVAGRYEKRVDHWLANAETKQYIQALAEALNTRDSGDLILTKRGRGGGTWLHPKLAVAFARWLDVKFAVWCDLHIDALLHGELNERQQFERACKALDDARHVASLSGKELAAWRWKKPGLECQVDHWREQLQMTLGLDAA